MHETENRSHESRLGIGDGEFLLNEGDQGKDDLPIDEIDEIDRCQNGEHTELVPIHRQALDGIGHEGHAYTPLHLTKMVSLRR
jgi:hypothetical protein